MRGEIHPAVWPEAGDDSDEAFSARLAACRRYAGVSQAQLATKLAVSRSYWANVENGRSVPVFREVWRVCELLDVNPWWLIEGMGFQRGFPADLDPRLARFVELLPDYGAFKTCLGLIFEYASTLGVDLFRLIDGQPPEKMHLTNVSEKNDNPDVATPMEKLRDRLKRATARWGKKAELARLLNVPRQCVSDWIAGKTEPGGDTTLRLLEWVEAEERNQPRSGAPKSDAGA